MGDRGLDELSGWSLAWSDEFDGAAGITAAHRADASLADDFHVYAVCWEPERIRWYLDDHLYSTVTRDDLQGRPWVFDHEFFLLLNVAVGGTFSVTPDPSTAFPQAMLVDYIRVCAGVVRRSDVPGVELSR
jgi:beta-glucanase (GH16 family)